MATVNGFWGANKLAVGKLSDLIHISGLVHAKAVVMLTIYFSHYRIDGAGDTSKDEVDSGDELEQTRFERDEVRKVEEQKTHRATDTIWYL